MKSKALHLPLLLMTVILCGAVVSAAYAASLPKINVDSRGIAIKGYDTVAYFTMRKPVMGNKKFSFQYDGATWLFSNQEHLNLFKNAPEKYMPQYGGY